MREHSWKPDHYIWHIEETEQVAIIIVTCEKCSPQTTAFVKDQEIQQLLCFSGWSIFYQKLTSISQVPTSHQPTGGIFLVVGFDRVHRPAAEPPRWRGHPRKPQVGGFPSTYLTLGWAWQAWSLELNPKSPCLPAMASKDDGTKTANVHHHKRHPKDIPGGQWLRNLPSDAGDIGFSS